MYRVLLPIKDRESRARAQAEAVLERPAAAGEIVVDIVHVHDDVSTADAEWAAGDAVSETYAEEMSEQADETGRLPPSVDAAVEMLESSGVEFAVHERPGTPAEEILELAAERDSDGIVLGVGGHSPVGKVLFGSVAQAVILNSDRPVTVVPESSEP